TVMGAAPTCRRNNRRSCRAPIWRRAARASISDSSSAPLSISFNALDTVAEVPRQASRVGELSGRQRRGPVSSLLRRGGTGYESAIRQLRRTGRADRPAVDAGRSHTGEEAPVVAGVTRQYGPVASCVLQFHATQYSPAVLTVSRFSDLIGVGAAPAHLHALNG